MKIVVTGAAGHLGRHIVHALHNGGHQLVATDRFYLRDLPVPLEVVDLANPDGCYRLLEGSEVLVHLGNIPGVHPGKPQVACLNNFATNVNVFQAALDTGVRKILYASSIQAISGERHPHQDGSLPPSKLPYLPLDSQLPTNPGTLYGLSKVAGEELLAYYAKVHGLSTISIRFPALIDSKQAKRDLDRVKRETLIDEGFTYLALSDAASLVSAVVKTDLPGFRIYLPASLGTTFAPISLDEIIAKYYPDVPVRLPFKFDNLVDLSEITRDTGWVPQARLYGA